MPLIHGFKSTNYSKAFALNAIAVAISSTLAIELRKYLDNNNINEKYKILITFIGVSVACFLTYLLLYILFGFGGGMLIQGNL